MRGHLRKRGKAWELRAYAGIDPLTGRQKYVTRTLRGAKREAEEALARLVVEVGDGGHAARDTTVGDLIREWRQFAGADLSPSTLRGYDRIIRSYILPAIGSVPVARLKTSQLDRFYANLRTKGGQDGKSLSTATVRQTHAILRRALQQGVRWGWITSNPGALASPPRVRGSRHDPPEPDEVVRLIQEASSTDPDLGCFLHLAATTGARRGELCGLRWADVDFSAGTMTISRNVVEGAGSQVIEKDTKTHAARRIALDPGSVAMLKAQRERMMTRATATGSTLTDDAHVFSADADGERPMTPNEVTKTFIRLRKRVGLDGVRLHDLRHFAATRLLAAGVPVRTVSGRLGHANAATTLGVYAHFLEVSDRDAAATLGALLTSPKPRGVRPSRTKKRTAGVKTDSAPVAGAQRVRT